MVSEEAVEQLTNVLSSKDCWKKKEIKPRQSLAFTEANSHLASQEIPSLLWNPKVHYHVH
jgi:hypothetical protein